MRNNNKKIHAMTDDGLVKIIRETLGDGSQVFNVRVHVGAVLSQAPEQFEIACINEDAANELFELLSQQDKFLL